MTGWIEQRSSPLAVALGLAVGAISLGFAVGDTLAEQANLAARWTARVALPFFLIAFTARAIIAIWPSPTSRAVLRRRRQWGLGFALAHIIHLAALMFSIVVAAPEPVRVTPSEAISGNLSGIVIYLFIIAMAATSNDRSARAMGRWWGRLHTLGGYAIWTAFTAAYAGRILMDDPSMQRTGIIFTSLMVGALALRLWARFRKRVTAP
jgi:methionine sulfoxide reductase heme-binding subunit